jgi:uncharacterized membrane protein YozB (DUF420 family)
MNAPATEARPLGSRYYYLVAAVLVVLVVFVGFAPSFYLKGHLGPARELSPLVQIHGAVMTAWFALFLVQTVLVRRGRTDVHRRLGYFGGFLAAALASLVLLVQFNATRDARAHLGTIHVEGSTIGFMLEFLLLVGLALWWRKRPETHKRLMLVATVILLGAAWGRYPVEFIRQNSGLFTKGGLVALVAADTWIHRRLHPAYLWGTLFVLAADFGLGLL